MTKRVSKSKKKRLVVFGTLSLIIIGYFIFSLGYYGYKWYSLKQEETKYSTLLVELKRQAKILNAEIEKLKDPEYIAAYARENFSYSKNGEKIIKISKKEEKKKEDKFELNIDYNYIIYGGLGALFILFIYVITKKK